MMDPVQGNGYQVWTARYGVVNVKDYGAVGDGVHDDTAAIQAAIDAGTSVFLPPAQYSVSSLTIPANTRLYGVGRNSILLANSPSDNLISVSGNGVTLEGLAFKAASGVQASNNNFIYNDGYHRLRMADIHLNMSNGMSNGIYVLSGQQILVSGLDIDGELSGAALYFYGVDVGLIASVRSKGAVFAANRPAIIRVSSSARVVIEHVNIRDIVGQATMTEGAQGIDIYGGNDIALANCISSNATSASGGGTIDGFTIEQDATNVSLVGCQASHNSGDGFDVYNVSFVTMDGCTAHNNQGFYGAEIFTSSDITLNGCDLSYNANGGATVNGSQRVVFTGGRLAYNNQHGVNLIQNSGSVQSTDVSFVGVQIYNNNQSGGADYDGIQLADNSDRVIIQGCEIFDNQATPTQTYGVEAANSAVANIQGNLFWGNKSGAINDAVNKSIKQNNQGYNPVGVITAPSVPASGTAYTNNYGYPVSVYVTGGTVTNIAVNGASTGLASGQFLLATGGTITLTYSATPSWTWQGL